MSDQSNQSVRFRFSSGSPLELFESSPRFFPMPVLLPKSQAESLEFDRPGVDHQSDRMGGRVFGVHRICKDNIGSSEEPLYHGYSGFEHERGICLVSMTDLPELKLVGGMSWGGNPMTDPDRMRSYFIPESRILGIVKEEWNHPREGRWVLEVVYAVVEDSLLVAS